MQQQQAAYPSAPALRRWLRAEQSLTARLRRHGPVQVQVLRQGHLPLRRAEQRDLQARSGYVREVILHLQGRPAVWARSATTARAVQGPWKALRGLGARPLAELLFAGAPLRRAPLQAARAPRQGALDRAIQRQWQHRAAAPQPAALPRWARSSVFWRHGAALRVMEVFAPWVAQLHPGA